MKKQKKEEKKEAENLSLMERYENNSWTGCEVQKIEEKKRKE